jgi:hypothetical protein
MVSSRSGFIGEVMMHRIRLQCQRPPRIRRPEWQGPSVFLQVIEHIPEPFGVVGIRGDERLVGGEDHLPVGRLRIAWQGEKFRAGDGGGRRNGPHRFHGKEVVETEVLKEFHVARADIERP